MEGLISNCHQALQAKACMDMHHLRALYRRTLQPSMKYTYNVEKSLRQPENGKVRLELE